jgi:hypothetical protein
MTISHSCRRGDGCRDRHDDCRNLSKTVLGPMVGDGIFERYGMRSHHQHIPRLLHQLEFSQAALCTARASIGA